MSKTTFTTRPFERSHGQHPRGWGSWAMQRTTSETAFDDELIGEIEWFSGTLTDAKRKARAAGMTGLIAILP